MLDYVLIVPGQGQEESTLSLLLALADRSRHVVLSHDDSGYLVPEYLAERYQQQVAEEEPAAPQVAEEEPAPKRRGRPPGRTKAAEAADKDGEE